MVLTQYASKESEGSSAATTSRQGVDPSSPPDISPSRLAGASQNLAKKWCLAMSLRGSGCLSYLHMCAEWAGSQREDGSCQGGRYRDPGPPGLCAQRGGTEEQLFLE